MMSTQIKSANAIGGKTARACDSCLTKRARWFCAADDAFLCQSCDISVHSANQLASRHDRVRLETSSFKASHESKFVDTKSQPSWHQGFTRKPRTPRNGKNKTLLERPKKDKDININIGNPFPFVPEICSEEDYSPDDNEEQLLYRVPVFDHFEAELCNVIDEADDQTTLANNIHDHLDDACDDLGFPGYLSTDLELAEFAADVETLLGDEFREEDDAKIELNNSVIEGERVKIEFEDEGMREEVDFHLDPELDMAREALNWNFEYESPLIGEEDDMVEQKVMGGATDFALADSVESKDEANRKLLLRLNYEDVISAWASRSSSPWADGIKPHLNPEEWWPDLMEPSHGVAGAQQTYDGHVRGDNEGREARVSRYREKRRTRLFSKKIRYEVRKLNAEKRPRLKGRFVKRTSFPASSGFPYHMNKSL